MTHEQRMERILLNIGYCLANIQRIYAETADHMCLSNREFYLKEGNSSIEALNQMSKDLRSEVEATLTETEDKK